MTAALFDEREDPGRKVSALLAIAVHAALFILLVYGIRWQTRSPEAVEVELVRALPAPAEPTPPVKPEPKIAPRPVPEIEPLPQLKPTPAVKPDIALKDKDKPKPKPEPKPEARPEPKPKAEPKPDDRAARELLNRELKDLAAQREQQMAAQELAQMRGAQNAAARNKAAADYIGRIKGKIKGNIMLPPDIQGNPEAIFDVVQLPGGEIISVKLKQSSGHAGYDNAIERAILKSSPLPKPEHSELFSRSLELHFRPLEDN